MSKFKVAAVQMRSSNIVEQNLRAAELAISSAALNGAKLIVLPEMFAVMGKNQTDKVDSKEKFQTGEIQSFISKKAIENDVWIVAGTIPIECSNETKIKAASILFNNKGEIIARYDKIHLFDVVLSDKERYQESDTTEAGDTPVIVDTPFGKIGLAVCYDIRFPELFRFYAENSVDIIALPSAFTVKTGSHWDKLCVARAIENFCYVIGSCQGGEHVSGRKTYGNSVIIDPWGDVVSKIDGDKQGIIYGDIDLHYLQQIRTSIPALSHRKLSLNKV